MSNGMAVVGGGKIVLGIVLVVLNVALFATSPPDLQAFFEEWDGECAFVDEVMPGECICVEPGIQQTACNLEDDPNDVQDDCNAWAPHICAPPTGGAG